MIHAGERIDGRLVELLVRLGWGQMFAMLSPSISMTSSKHTKSNTGRNGASARYHRDPAEPSEIAIEGSDETVTAPRHRYDGRICEAEFRIALTAKGLKGVEKQLRARNEIDLTRL